MRLELTVRQGRYGWERWNGFTEEWWPLSYHVAMLSWYGLCRHYAGCRLIQRPASQGVA